MHLLLADTHADAREVPEWLLSLSLLSSANVERLLNTLSGPLGSPSKSVPAPSSDSTARFKKLRGEGSLVSGEKRTRSLSHGCSCYTHMYACVSLHMCVSVYAFV